MMLAGSDGLVWLRQALAAFRPTEKKEPPNLLREILCNACPLLSSLWSVRTSGRKSQSSFGLTPRAFASFLRICIDG